MKSVKITIHIFTLGLALFGWTEASQAADCYVDSARVDNSGNGLSLSSAKKYITSCFPVINSGDTVWIQDGTYTNSADFIGYDPGVTAPPNGPGVGSGDGRFTIVRAINEGQVTIRRTETGGAANLAGNSSWIKFHGIIFEAQGSGYGNYAWTATGDGNSGGSHHIYLYRCGFFANTGGSSTMWTSADYMLIEECYVWGRGRYGIHFHQPGRNQVARRNVVRLDDADGGGNPIHGFQSYGGRNVEFQNNIILDQDARYWTSTIYPYSGFSARDEDNNAFAGDNVAWRGDIALNLKNSAADSYVGGQDFIIGYVAGSNSTPVTNMTVENSVAWDLDEGYGALGNAGATGQNVIFKNVTIGDIKDTALSQLGDGIRSLQSANGSIKNAIVYKGRRSQFNDCDGAVSYSNANSGGLGSPNFFNMPAPTVGITTYDPTQNGLEYLPRIESGSNLASAGENSQRVGAELTKQYGVSGTFYGEAGYADLTNEDLWPFPYEDQIKADMSSHNPASGPSGTRGFAASGNGLYGGPITLTSYVWEYLGNPCPAEICGGQAPSDTTAPSAPQGLSVN